MPLIQGSCARVADTSVQDPECTLCVSTPSAAVAGSSYLTRSFAVCYWPTGLMAGAAPKHNIFNTTSSSYVAFSFVFSTNRNATLDHKQECNPRPLTQACAVPYTLNTGMCCTTACPPTQPAETQVKVFKPYPTAIAKKLCFWLQATSVSPKDAISAQDSCCCCCCHLCCRWLYYSM